jgi:hypothetical protein
MVNPLFLNFLLTKPSPDVEGRRRIEYWDMVPTRDRLTVATPKPGADAAPGSDGVRSAVRDIPGQTVPQDRTEGDALGGYQAALAQPRDKRAAFLALACPHDPLIRGEV